MPAPIVNNFVVRGVRKFLDALNSSGGTPIEQLSPKDARQVLIDAQKSVQVDLSGIERSEKTIDHDGEPLKLHIMRPAGAKSDLPVFMFFHGGGWVLGDYPTHERLVRDLVVESGAMAVFPDYTPSPEAHYPTAIHQAYAATKWVSEHGGEIGADGTRLAVVGNSVGGNMAAVVSLMAKDQGGPRISFQALLWPVTDARFDTESYKEFAEGHFLTRNMMIWFWDNYTKEPAQRAEMYASPLRAPAEALQGLPPALVQTAHSDVLRDEGEAYARRLNEAGVEVVAVRYNGLIHDWGLLNPIAAVPEVRGCATASSIAVAQQHHTAAQTSDEELIKSAMSAAPPAVAQDAAIVAVGPDGKMRTIRKGSNTFTCMPDNPATPGPDPMCMDQNGLEWATAWIEHRDPPKGKVGFMYMLAGGTDASNTDPYAQKPDANNNWVETGPHVMLVGAKGMIEGYPRAAKPDTSQPYVMWPDTPYEHLMIPVQAVPATAQK